MKNYQTIGIVRLTNLDFIDLINTSLKLVEDNKIKTKTQSINLHLVALKEKLPLYQNAIRQIRASLDTKQIAQLDMERDHDIQALFQSVRLFQHSRRANEIEAYNQLKLILNNYKNLQSLAYSKQSILVEKLLDELSSDKAGKAVEELAISKFVTNLKASQAAFEKTFDKRRTSHSLPQEHDTNKLRKEITTRYKLLCMTVQNLEYLNRMGELSTPEAADFFRCLNQARKNVAERVRRSQTQKNKHNSLEKPNTEIS